MANKDAIRDPKGEGIENGAQAKLTKDMKLYRVRKCYKPKTGSIQRKHLGTL